MEQEKRQKAMDCALYYLGFRARTKKQMIDYLKKKEFEEAIIAVVIDDLLRYNYLNDERFAKGLMESQLSQNKKGKRAIQQKLWQAGIERETMEATLNELDEEKEMESALYWVQKWCIQLQHDSKKREKIYRRLASRGFTYTTIVQAMSTVSDDNNYEEWE